MHNAINLVEEEMCSIWEESNYNNYHFLIVKMSNVVHVYFLYNLTLLLLLTIIKLVIQLTLSKIQYIVD